MTILVTGGTGQVGTALAGLEGSSFPVVAFSRDDWDISRSSDAARWINADTAAVVNCAAYTAVDQAEDDSNRAFLLNDAATAQLIEVCGRFGTPLVHLSTDYVFDGTKRGAYVEEDAVCPVGVYGRSKAAGDAHFADAHIPHVVLRVAWVFGAVGRSFVETMLRLAGRDELSVVDDQVGAPTPARAIAEVIRTILVDCGTNEPTKQAITERLRGASGVYHLASEPTVSWFEFAETIFERALHFGVIERAPRLLPIPSSEYPTKARRPNNSRLAMTKLEQAFGIRPIDWRRYLDDFLRELS